MSGTAADRVIAHADMDAFYAAIEQLDDPSLRRRPVIVGGPGGRGVVSTASYEARPYGIGSAMPMAWARRRCPQAVVVPPRFDRYVEISRQIMTVFGNFSPLVEPLSLDEAFVDMTGAEAIFGDADSIGRRMRAAVFDATDGLTVSVGIANTKFLAKVASDHDKPDGLTIIPPARSLEFLQPLAVSRLWGVGPKTQARLEALGLRTIADVARADPRWLKTELGHTGTHIYRLAHNVDDRDVVPHRGAKSVGSEYTLGTDVETAEDIRLHLRRSADEVGRRLRGRNLRARGVRVKLKTSSFRLMTRQGPLATPTDVARTLYAHAVQLLEQFELVEPLRLVGLAAFDLEDASEPIQPDLFGDPRPDRNRSLETTLDAVRARFGDGAIQRGEDVRYTAPPDLRRSLSPVPDD